MWRYALRQLVAQRVATAFAAAGLLTSIVGFIVLASTSQTAAATLRGDAEKQWTSPFDLLVRPGSAVSSLEGAQGLVRPNYLSGLVGGITNEQLLKIRQVPGVQVAAPIAIVGFVSWPSGTTLDLQHQVAGQAVSVVRISQTAIGEAGLSHYPTSTRYLVVAPSGHVDQTGLHVGSVTIPCTGVVECQDGSAGTNPRATTFVAFNEPVLLAGVDPAAEATLSGAAGCVSTGRYLQVGDKPQLGSETAPTVSVLASTTSFIDETVSVQVDQAGNPQGILAGLAPTSLGAWSPVAVQSNTADQLFQDFLSQGLGSYYNVDPVEVPGPVSYDVVGGDHLAARSVPPDLSVFNNPFGNAVNVPPEARDTWLRAVTAHEFVNSGTANAQGQPSLQPPNRWQVVGRFDPKCLTGFRSSVASLAGFASASVTMSDRRSLGATRSVAGYVNPPPALLTTLDGATYFADPNRFAGGPGAAFISSIRIRVANVQQPGALSEDRLARVAADIHAATGLAVDIIKGSAQTAVTVDLPAGGFGRPPLTVTEGWTAKGVVVNFVTTVARANLALFAVVLLGAAILVGQTTYSAARRRRQEFGVLRACGWSPGRLALLVEMETVTLAAAVGLVAVLVDAVVSLLLHTGSLGWQLALSPVVAIGLAALAAALPAILISRASVVDTLRRPGRSRRRSRPPSLGGFALREMSAWRTEAVLGAAAVGLGGALIGGAVLISTSFGGEVDASLLGTVVSDELRSFHVVLGILVLLIGMVAAGQIVTLSYLERQPDLAVLRALGWQRRTVAAVVVIQALVLGLVGGIGAAACVVVAGWLLGAGFAPTVVAACTALGVAAIAGGCASAGPLLLAWTALPSSLLRN